MTTPPPPGRVPDEEQAAGWTAGPWLAAARPSSIVGWPVVAPQSHGRLICDMAWVSPSAERSQDADVRAYLAEVGANARLIAAAPTMAAIVSRLAAKGDAEAISVMEAINAAR